MVIFEKLFCCIQITVFVDKSILRSPRDSTRMVNLADFVFWISFLGFAKSDRQTVSVKTTLYWDWYSVSQTNEIQNLYWKNSIGRLWVNWLTFRQDKRKLRVSGSPSPPLQNLVSPSLLVCTDGWIGVRERADVTSKFSRITFYSNGEAPV